MANRFARPTLDALARYRADCDALLEQPRANDDTFSDALRALDLVCWARDTQRKVLWASRTLGWATTTP